MFANMKNKLFGAALLGTLLLSAGGLSAAPKKSPFPIFTPNYTPKAVAAKSYGSSYTKQAPYAGYGKPSKVNGQPKTKIVSGHTKKTSKGYTYVNPYARSK